MSLATLHLLDSIHTWLLVVMSLSAVGGGIAALGCIEASEFEWQKLLGGCAAIVFAVTGTLAAFIPTSESLDKARNVVRHAAKQEWCTAHPGECK